MNDTEYAAYTESWILKVKRILKNTASLYICCDWRTSLIIGSVLQHHFTVQNRITWQREKGRGAKRNWKNSMEDIWFATMSPKSFTLLSLSALQKYDDRSFIVCVCTPLKNYMLLSNSTFLSKISHSSMELRIDNIKGSFNGSDIIRQVDCIKGTIKNIPENFDVLFGIHQNIPFEDNLARLVEATNGIVPTGKRFDVSVGERQKRIMNAPKRAIAFSSSTDYIDLRTDLNNRTSKYENEILVAACIENVNLRGRIIEYIIAGNDLEMRSQIIKSLYNKTEFPRMITRDGLGDYAKRYPDFYTETDIKTKIMVLASAPKGYNLDKMLEFLAEDNTVFMIYLVGIDYEKDYIKQATNPVISRFIACLSFNLSLVCRLNLLNDT